MRYVIVFSILLLTACSSKCIETSTIEDVGGCNENGRCGVKYRNGNYGQEYYPTKGQTVCTKEE